MVRAWSLGLIFREVFLWGFCGVFVGFCGVFVGFLWFLWGLCWNMVKDGKYVLKSCFLEGRPNWVSIKLGNRFFYKLLGIRFSLYPSGKPPTCITYWKPPNCTANWKSGSCLCTTLLIYLLLDPRFWLGHHSTGLPVSYLGEGLLI